MVYKVVFDLSNVGYMDVAWPYVAGGCIFTLIGIWGVMYAHRVSIFGHFSRTWRRLFSFIFLSFAIAWSVFTFIFTYSQFKSIKDPYQKGNYHIVEGIVTNFIPMPYSGHSEECFTVDARRFCYSDYGTTPGFNNTQSHGGPIKPGLCVRISYIGNVIVKLEIGEDQEPYQPND
jgi:hypothetical protein